MKRSHWRILNLFAFSLLGFSIYLNFFYKENEHGRMATANRIKAASSQVITQAPK
ncbi:MAG TPA: hypothetical protein VFS31_17145 [Chitinophagaceae bacterium]|jgi:hypothetical protein|nr:hypothetical protein [Chitinophagaceae bacterium]